MQVEMLQILFDIGMGIQSQKQQAVVVAVANVAEAEVDAQTARVQLVVLEEQVVTSCGERDGQAAVAKSAAEAVIAAKQAYAVEETRAETLASERVCLEAEKEEYESVVQDSLVPLKEGTLSGLPRREMLELLSEVLGKLGVDQSLLDSLPVSLKPKVEGEERGHFAQMVVAAAEDALQKHVTHLSDQFAGKDTEVADCAHEVQRAQSALATAQTVQGVCFDSQVAAENALQDAERLRQEALSTINALETNITERSAELEGSRLESASVSDALVQFAKLRDGVQDQPEAAIADEEVAVVNMQDISQAPVAVLEVAAVVNNQDISQAPVEKDDVPVVAPMIPLVHIDVKGVLPAAVVPTMHTLVAAGA